MFLALDMDEVICGFKTAVETLGPRAAQGLVELTGKEPTEAQKQGMYDAIEACGEKFWSTLPWKIGGKQLWMLVKPYKPVLLTSPGLFKYAKSGKLLWVKKFIPGTPIFFSDEKSEYVDPYDKSILIDDNKTNISSWEDAGGIGILHTSYEETKEKFLKIVSNNI